MDWQKRRLLFLLYIIIKIIIRLTIRTLSVFFIILLNHLFFGKFKNTRHRSRPYMVII
jgi:hypothetical protein